MMIELDDFCDGLERIADGRLTNLIPAIVDAIENDKSLAIGIDGSRDSAKSNFAARIISSMINSEFVLSLQIAATAANLLDSGFGSLIAEFTGGVITPKHITNTPAQIDLTGFHESRGERVKDSQKKYDVTIIDETGNWKAHAAISALNTWAKHSKVIIIIANRMPTYIDEWIKTNNNFRRVRVDYFENPFCPKETFDRHEKMRVNNPALWNSEVMYSDTFVNGLRIFSLESVDNALKINPGAVPAGIRNVISVDVGGESNDPHAIIHCRQTFQGHLFFTVEKLYNATQPTLSKDVRYIRADTHSTTEVWDASGIGGAVLDYHCPSELRMQNGIFEFRGNDSGNNNRNGTNYFNRRSESYFLLSEAMGDGLVHFVGGNEDKHYVDILKEELMATIIDESKDLKIAEKPKIKTNLGGRSPNLADALSMAVWYCLTQPLSLDQAREYRGRMDAGSQMVITGAPSLD